LCYKRTGEKANQAASSFHLGSREEARHIEGGHPFCYPAMSKFILTAGKVFGLGYRKATLILQKTFAVVAVSSIVAVLLFLLIEGLSEFIFVTKYVFWDSLSVAETRHTKYDEELGWVNLPNIYIKDMYGPGKFFRSNSQSFRNDKDFSRSVPYGKVRLICSGDSFTMGYGVDNKNTWCELLGSINGRIESINMGQGGYGVDQAYLWYKRNSAQFDHDVHIFALISGDLGRMASDTFLGYGKPLLELRNGHLVNIDRPVPKGAYYFQLPQVQEAIKNLSSVRLLTSILSRVGAFSAFEREDKKTNQRIQEVALKIFQDLQRINQAKKSTLVLVLLPAEVDYMTKYSEYWREFLYNETAKNGWLFIDLIEEIRNYPPQEVGTLFKGHYSEKGNAYIAEILYKKLLAIPEISRKFS